MSKTALSSHVYISDGVVDHVRHVETCQCGLPRSHPRHEMPTVPREVIEAEERRLGEHDSE